jgi:hypothetical protein
MFMARRFAELNSVMEEGSFRHVTRGCDVDHSYGSGSERIMELKIIRSRSAIDYSPVRDSSVSHPRGISV